MNEFALPLRLFTIAKKLDKTSTEAEKLERNLQIADELVGIIRTFKVQDVAIEGYAYGKALHAHQVGETGGIVKSQIWLSTRIMYQLCPPKTGRKYLFGYGNVDKKFVHSTIREAMAHNLGVDVSTDHESDAYVVAHWLFAQVSTESLKSQFDMSVLK